MRSIPLALTWELTTYGRWSLIAAALGAHAVFWLVLIVLEIDGQVDVHDPSMLTMHIAFVQINAGAFGAALLTAQGRLARLFPLPVTTPTLVAWRLIPSMVLVALELAASTALVNFVFGLDWPVWGPALAAAVALAAVNAVFWLFERSAWILVALVLVGAVLGCWFTARYGAMFAQPNQYWTTVTIAEISTMLVAAALAYCAAVVGVARNRRGEAPFNLGILDWIDHVFRRTPVASLPFRSPAHAQFWSEWQSKGWGTPGVVVVCLLLMICIWLFTGRDYEELFKGFVAGGGLLSAAGMIGGMILGNYGTKDGVIMSQFLATRPMTDTELAKTTLKTTALGVIAAWAIWVAAFLAYYAFLRMILVVPDLGILKSIGWWYFPATLLGPWIGATVMLPVFMSGRSTPFAAVVTGAMFLFIGLMLYSKFGLSREAQERFMQGLTMAAGITMLAATAWTIVAAWNRRLIARSTMYVALVTWVALCAPLIAECVLAHELYSVNILAAGLVALAVAPLATAPLAAAWNRHR
ncbi:MAG: hypothetical protein WD669_04295 [Pirellulales bacterium]